MEESLMPNWQRVAVGGGLRRSAADFPLHAGLVFRVFFGSSRSQIRHRSGPVMKISLAVLAIFSIADGFIELPPTLGNMHLFSEFLQSTLPSLWASVFPSSLIHWTHSQLY